MCSHSHTNMAKEIEEARSELLALAKPATSLGESDEIVAVVLYFA